MRFESDHRDPNEKDFEDGLGSAELQALADQLRDDAAYLSLRYPARVPGFAAAVADLPECARKTARPWNRWLEHWQVAAALLLVALGVGVIVVDGGWQQDSPERFGGAGNALPPPTRFVDQGGASRPLPFVPANANVTPVKAFHELSVSEKEAVLDLLEEQPTPQPGLSL